LFSASLAGGRVSVRCSPSLGALQALSAFFEVEYDIAAAVEALAEALSRVSVRCHPRDYMCVYSSAEALAVGLEDPQALSKALTALEDVFYIPRAAYVNRELGRAYIFSSLSSAAGYLYALAIGAPEDSARGLLPLSLRVPAVLSSTAEAASKFVSAAVCPLSRSSTEELRALAWRIWHATGVPAAPPCIAGAAGLGEVIRGADPGGARCPYDPQRRPGPCIRGSYSDLEHYRA